MLRSRGVARIVHRDHRAEVLGQLGGLVADGDPTRGAEGLGVPAGVEHVVVAGHRPMAGAGRELLADERLVKCHRSLSAQGGERAVTYVVVEAPEVPRREVDVRQRNLGRNGAVHPGRDTHVASLRVSFVTGSAPGPSLLLHLGLEHVARALLQLLTHRSLVFAEDRPVDVVELLDHLERPPPVEHVAADQIALQPIGQRPRAPRRAACRTLRQAAGRHGP